MQATHVRLGEGIRHLSIGAVVERSLGILNTIVLLRGLAIGEFGALVLIYTVYTFVDFLVGLGQGDLVVARCARATGSGGRDEEDAARLYPSYAFLVLLGTAAVLIVGVLGRWAVVDHYPSLATTYWIALAGVLLTPARNLVVTRLRIQQAFRSIRSSDILRGATLTTGYLFFVTVAGYGLQGALAATALANVVLLIVFGRMSLGRLSSEPLSLRPIFKLLRGEGSWQLVRYGTVVLQASARPWLIQFSLGTEAVALFHAAKSVLGMPMDLLPIKEALIPIMSQAAGRRSELKELFADSARYATWVYGTMAVGIVILAPLVFGILFNQYSNAVPLIRLMALNLLTSGLATPQVAIFYALGLQKAYFHTTLIGFLTMVLCSPPLMWFLGVEGMAISFVATSLVVVALRQRYLVRRYPELGFTWLTLVRPAPGDWQVVRHMLMGR